MSRSALINSLREDAEWAQANEWETPITLGDHLTEAAAEIETLEKENSDLRNALCLKCGRYHRRHLGACDGCRWRE